MQTILAFLISHRNLCLYIPYLSMKWIRLHGEHLNIHLQMGHAGRAARSRDSFIRASHKTDGDLLNLVSKTSLFEEENLCSNLLSLSIQQMADQIIYQLAFICLPLILWIYEYPCYGAFVHKLLE